jgi:hypothetical protein
MTSVLMSLHGIDRENHDGPGRTGWQEPGVDVRLAEPHGGARLPGRGSRPEADAQ